MAYAAVVSLKQILEQLLRSNDQFSTQNQKSQIKSLHSKVRSLEAFLKNIFPENDLEIQIRDAIHEAEDIIESHISTEYESSGDEILSRDLHKVLQELDSVEKRLFRFGETINLVPVASSRSASAVESNFLGHKDSFVQLKDQVIGESSTLKVVSVVGMGGIGKTTLVKEIFDDPSIAQFFHYRAWATVGANYHTRETLLGLLCFVDPSVVQSGGGSEQLVEYLFKNLKGRRYLIVLDDICDIKAWNDLKRLFPDDSNESRIILTTRVRTVAMDAAGTTRNVHQIRFMNKEESWDLLRKGVFGTRRCPSELVKIGKKIAENCQGLPLTILTFSRILSRVVETPDEWKKVADRQTSGVTDTNEMDHDLTEMMQILNDKNLPQHLKACFMYMGAFPLNSEIAASKLIKLWVSEGFLEPKESKTLEEVAEECLEELYDRNLILVHKWRSTGGIKTCSTHSSVWFLCVTAAEKDTFFRAISRYNEKTPPQTTDSLRRICIRQNVLFAIKDVHKSLASAKLARSLLCLGPDNLYPLSVFLSYVFLRVLDALTLPFYEFPILNLVRLRYLALTCNGELPPSVFKLWRLQCLIVQRRLSIKSSGVSSYLPIEIWNMKELRHLQVMGRDLPKPSDGHLLPNLLTLSNVSGHTCTKDVLERTPNLKKLGIRIELAEDDDRGPFCIFDHLNNLVIELESFKCVIVNPSFESQFISRPDLSSTLPYTLKKLTLSGCGFPWEDVKVFALLPNLEVLKLLCYAFRGFEWELDQEEFKKLKHLLLEDMELKHWIAVNRILPRLERLVIRHCYSLKEIPLGFGYIPTLQMMELVDCSPSVVGSALLIKEMQEDMSNDDLQLSIHSSWEKKNLK